MTKAPKFVLGEEFNNRKARWKVTEVYGYRASYDGNLYAAVRWIKKNNKWSGNEYLFTERHMEKISP